MPGRTPSSTAKGEWGGRGDGESESGRPQDRACWSFFFFFGGGRPLILYPGNVVVQVEICILNEDSCDKRFSN